MLVHDLTSGWYNLKEHAVPNGGFSFLPDSLITKQIADIIKRRPAQNSAVESSSAKTGQFVF